MRYPMVKNAVRGTSEQEIDTKALCRLALAEDATPLLLYRWAGGSELAPVRLAERVKFNNNEAVQQRIRWAHHSQPAAFRR